MSAPHGELFDTELGLYRLPEHRQMVKASDPAQTWFDIEQRRGPAPHVMNRPGFPGHGLS